MIRLQASGCRLQGCSLGTSAHERRLMTVRSCMSARTGTPVARSLKSEALGFTLLEVMVALSILALALVAIAGINANSFESSNYAKHVTVATLLARSKMIDIEEELRKEGFGSDEKSWDGDFTEEGYPGMRWKAVARPVEVNVAQLLGPMLGGEVSSDQLPEEMQGFLGALNGQLPTDSEEAAKYAEEVGGSELKQLMGGEAMEGIFKQIGETLGDSIREITLEIEWGKENVDLEEIKFVQYVTTTGRLSFQPQVASTQTGGGGGNRDTDGDGQLDSVDTDDDGDGTPDAQDTDDDDDGVPDDQDPDNVGGVIPRGGGPLTKGGRPPLSGGLLPPTLPGGFENPALDPKEPRK